MVGFKVPRAYPTAEARFDQTCAPRPFVGPRPSAGTLGSTEILLRSETGEWTWIAKRAAMKERHLQAYWPEANVLRKAPDEGS